MLRADNSLFKNYLFLILTLITCLFVAKGITLVHFSVPLILIIGFFAFVLAFTHTNMSLVLLIFLMLLSPEIILGAVTRRDVVLRIDDLLIIAFSFAWLARTAVNQRIHFIRRTPINKFIAFYIVIFIISTSKGMIITDRLKISTGLFYILKYIEYFLIFYLAAGITTNRKQVKTYLKAFIITFLIVNIYAFTQIGSGRVSAPFEGKMGEPNTLGGYQVLLLGVILGLIIHLKSIKWKISLSAIAILSLVPFAYTLSRASYAAILPMFFTLIIYAKTSAKNILLGFLIVAIILLIFFFPQNIKDRIAYTFVPEVQENIPPFKILGVTMGPSASARLHDWVRQIQDWRYKPFLGYGVTGKGFLDSQYIRTLVELGALGFIVFLSLLASIFTNTLRIYRKAKDDMLKGFAIGFLAGHVGMVVHALTANTFILIRIMEPYWFLAALVMVIPYIEEPEIEKDIEKKNKPRKKYNLTRILNYEQKYRSKLK